MAHPPMFEDDDPMLQRLREFALAFPGAAEKVSHGRPMFFTKKIFAGFGGSLKVEGDWVQHPQSLIFLPDPEDRLSFDTDDRIFVPAYWGPYGWRGIDLHDDTDWVEVDELLDASFRLTTSKKLIAELDARA